MFDFIVNFNEYINYFITTLGMWFYVLLFFIIFYETGIILGVFFLVTLYFFTVSITAAATGLNIHLAVLTICLGAITGDICNYLTGRFIGERMFALMQNFLKKYIL